MNKKLLLQMLDEAMVSRKTIAHTDTTRKDQITHQLFVDVYDDYPLPFRLNYYVLIGGQEYPIYTSKYAGKINNNKEITVDSFKEWEVNGIEYSKWNLYNRGIIL